MKRLLFFMVATSYCFTTWGQYPSLSAEDFAEVLVKDKNNDTYYITCHRSSSTSNLWYYIPKKPRLVEKNINGIIQPEFTLLAFGITDPMNPQLKSSGGILQFTSTYQVEPGVLEQLKLELQKIARARGFNTNITVAALSPSNAEVSLYYPTAGDSLRFLNGTPKGSGIAPIYATQNMAFTVPLTTIGTDIIDTLSKSNTGLGLAIVFTFYGKVTCSFKIKVNYSQVYKHYSKDEKLKVAASYYGLFGASYQKTTQEIYNSLSSDKSIEIEIDPSEKCTKEYIIENFLSPILQRINQEILQQTILPQTIPAQAADPSASGKFFSAGYSVALKDESSIKTMTETVVFKLNDLVERKTLITGFMGVGKYSADIKKALFINLNESNFKEANIILPPTVFDSLWARKRGIRDVLIEIGIMKNGRLVEPKPFFWNPDSKEWRYMNLTPSKLSTYSLLGFDNDDQAKNRMFRVYRLVQTTDPQDPGLKELRIEDTMFLEYSPAGVHLDKLYTEVFDVIKISSTAIDFNRVDNKSPVSTINITILYDKDKRIERTIEPKKESSGSYSAPETLIVLMDKRFMKDLIINMQVIQKNGKKINWINNGKPISSYQYNYRIELSPEEFQ